MRWENLTIDHTEGTRLPGYRDAATVRTFDAPEALKTRFYEVRSKSALNRVPEKSAMPFRWTVNPYRGCSHACVYCLGPDTPVLMADGRHRRIAGLKAGDRIYGTEQRGAHRRFVHTEVVAKWNTTKDAYRVVLADGTELIASGDHRFLSERGWKHVVGAEQGAARRPHLTLNNRLIGTGAFAEPPRHDEDYRHGYLCGTTAGQRVARVEERIAWPTAPTDSWRKGFLAGIFDAEGHRDVSILRIANNDPVIVNWTLECLRCFGFDAVLERVDRTPAMYNVRLRGGLTEHLRFIHTVDPAIRRRATFEGQALKTKARLGVVAIEPLGPMRLCDITTGTGDFIADGVVSHNCFARPTHTYLGFNAAEDFDHEIVVKVNAPEVLRAELKRPSWKHEHVALGTNTDPYQWVESKYRLMPGIWEALRDSGTPCSVLTKSPLLLRDLALFKELAATRSFMASLSIPTMEPKAWRATEPHTPHPQARMEAVAELNRNGIPTSILIAPLMPGINDDPRQVEAILAAAADAGATNVSGIALHLRGEVRGVFMDWLRSSRPDLVERYEELYARGAYAPEAERRRIVRLITRGRLAHPDAFDGSDLFRSRSPDGSLRPENPAALRFGDRPATGRQRPFVRPQPDAEAGSRPAPPIQGSLF